MQRNATAAPGAFPKVGRALAASVAFALLASATNAGAESRLASSAAGGLTARAAVSFRIIVPHVLFVDTRSGIVYSNDGGTRARRGRADVTDVGPDASTLVRASELAGAANSRRVGGAVLPVAGEPHRAPGVAVRAGDGTVDASRAIPARVHCVP